MAILLACFPSRASKGRERGVHFIHSASLAYEDGILSLLQQGNETMADRLLLLMPHEHTHAPCSKKLCFLLAICKTSLAEEPFCHIGLLP